MFLPEKFKGLDRLSRDYVGFKTIPTLYFIYSKLEVCTEKKTLKKKGFMDFVSARSGGLWMETQQEELHGDVSRQTDRRRSVHCHCALFNRARLNRQHLNTTSELNLNCQQTE